MKKHFFLMAILAMSAIASKAQLKKDGTPDMRYNSNKQTYGNSYSTPSYSQPKQERNYESGGQYKVQDGYMKSNGTYVSPHIKTTPDNNLWNNKNAPR